MLISPEQINKTLAITGNAVTNKGKKYFEQGRVKPFMIDYNSDENFDVNSIVYGTKKYSTKIKKESGKIDYSCTCPHFEQTKILPCKHIIAMLFDMYINFQNYYDLSKKQESKTLDEIEADEKTLFKQKSKKEQITNINFDFSLKNLDNTYLSYYEKLELDDEESLNDKVSLIPLIDIYGFRNSKLRLYFKIGRDKFYTVKDIYELGYSIYNNTSVKFSKNFEIIPSIKVFNESSKILAKIIEKSYLEESRMSNILYYTKDITVEDKKYLDITSTYLDEIFEIYKSKSLVALKSEAEEIQFLDMDPNFEFDIKENKNGSLILTNNSSEFTIFTGINYSYVLKENTLFRCSEKYTKNVLPFLKELKKNGGDEFIILNSNKTSFCDFVLPKISASSNVNVENGIVEKYSAQELVTQIYLDVDKSSNIIANVKFCYDDVIFNPFLLKEEENIKCNRNLMSETKVKKLLAKYKFNVNTNKGYIFLNNEDDIYEFFTTGIEVFMNKFEVLITDKLKNRQIINTSSLNFGVKLKNDLLDIELGGLDVSEEDLKSMLEKYRIKKKYHRLKNGTFINLTGYGIETLALLNEEAGVSEAQLLKGNISLPKYRALFVDNLLKSNDGINVQKSTDFRSLIKDFNDFNDATYKIPKNLNANLRQYQIVGYNWLKTLSNYGFGGILADDMGLGKTLQVITFLLDEKNSGSKTTSLVVCPSSLYINWEKEIKKFAPDLNSLVIFGNIKEREKLIKKYNKYDVVITSYDMLKRDIELYKDISFKYIIADEAQYIKNNNTKNAKALKKLKANVRFALTGTPIENSLSELWSIFDYIMPGYLFTYSKFKNNYESLIIKEEDKEALERLKKIVAPFVLRRIKKEVLKELPDKTETIMYNQMEDEQRKVYEAYLYSAKKEMESEITKNGFESSKMKILASITRLRQICSHPGLFLDEYEGESSKLNQCIQIIEDAVNSGHKILVFSSFTSMFDILSKKLKEKNIKYDILTGATKSSTRVDMVEDFNVSDNVKVFLISLKAGGTGLNLIGADMVIHYDPWWNLSAQNQATDRAYRIGQKNNVQVFKLITQNSIEEKILKLQEKKQDITTSVISDKETFISKMSKEEIMELFSL